MKDGRQALDTLLNASPDSRSNNSIRRMTQQRFSAMNMETMSQVFSDFTISRPWMISADDLFHSFSGDMRIDFRR